jgi:truncated hemoglobin YjbI
VTEFSYPNFRTQHGYMTKTAQTAYVATAMDCGLLPSDTMRRADLVSLKASNDLNVPIQFWQLFSVLGPDPIVAIVQSFYERVFADEDWFTSVFARIGGVEHHTMTQASMWADAMGGGPYYHGAEFRLSFHHTHNAMAVMNDRGAARWVSLMVKTLAASDHHMTDDPRVRIAINTFLTHFLGTYAVEFGLGDVGVFGAVNGPYIG